MEEFDELKIAQRVTFDVEDLLPPEYSHRVRNVDDQFYSDTTGEMSPPAYFNIQAFEEEMSHYCYQDNIATCLNASYPNSFNPLQLRDTYDESIFVDNLSSVALTQTQHNQKRSCTRKTMLEMRNNSYDSPIIRTTVSVLSQPVDIFNKHGQSARDFLVKNNDAGPQSDALSIIKKCSSDADVRLAKKSSGIGSVTDSISTNNIHCLSIVDSRSCPDLSNDQLKIWSEILHKAVETEKKESNNHNSDHLHRNTTRIRKSDANVNDPTGIFKIMTTSAYELCPATTFDALEMAVNADNFCNNGGLDKRLKNASLHKSFTEMVNGRTKMTVRTNPAFIKQNSLTTKLCKPAKKRNPTNDSSDDEDELIFKPVLSKYGHPQSPTGRAFMTTFSPEKQKTTSGIESTKKLSNGNIQPPHMDQMHCANDIGLQVNPFESEDAVLSESECPPPSPFQQLQWALQRRKQKYFESSTGQIDQPPQRVCCEIM
ncbi:hypothetical protein DdX_00161 [Ditylenchus destructor]|uniref:Uncharacterized protein n=1 Tax=Ditylenchus destructor TaxID=166010 RepID=A0AAD4NGW0_9BILA|nr:hypothetical protein DdX_00161 [Ditylenchus destructor]